MVIKEPKWDKAKTLAETKRDIGKTCSVPGCKNPITAFHGPGSDSMCRDHQINLIEYGGTGRMGRDHSHHREWKCEWCGYDPREDPRFDMIEDPERKLAAMRASLIADHKERKADGGSDDAENIQTLCNICNNIKTMMNGDTISTRNKMIKKSKKTVDTEPNQC